MNDLAKDIIREYNRALEQAIVEYIHFTNEGSISDISHKEFVGEFPKTIINLNGKDVCVISMIVREPYIIVKREDIT